MKKILFAAVAAVVMSVFASCGNGSGASVASTKDSLTVNRDWVTKRIVDTVRVENSDVVFFDLDADSIASTTATRAILREKIHYSNGDIETKNTRQDWLILFVCGNKDKGCVKVNSAIVDTLSSAYVIGENKIQSAEVSLKRLNANMKFVDASHVMEDVVWAFKTKDKTYTHQGTITTEFHF